MLVRSGLAVTKLDWPVADRVDDGAKSAMTNFSGFSDFELDFWDFLGSLEVFEGFPQYTEGF